jgi:sugar porter (SP) family MFS transporter
MDSPTKETDIETGVQDGDVMDMNGLTLLEVVPKLDKMWWHYPHLLKLNTLLLCAIMWSTASGFDGSLFNGMQALPQWMNYFGNPTGSRLGISSVPATVTNIVTNLVFYKVLEVYGRRRPLMVGCLLIIIGAFVKAASQNYAMWIWTPIIQQLGSSIVSMSAPPYITETAYPTHRGKAVAMYSVTYQLGALIAAGMNWALLKVPSTWAWRGSLMMQALPSIIQLILAYLAPESPRWLIYNDKANEAFEILVKYHGGGDRNSRLVHFEMNEIVASLQAEKDMKKSKWSEYSATKGMRHRLAITVFMCTTMQWTGNALISYYLPKMLDTVGITSPEQVLGINLGLTGFALLCGLFAASNIDRFGRKPLILAGYSLMCLSYFILTIAAGVDTGRNFKDKGLAGCVVLMIYCFQGFYHFASATANTYIMEITPFALRSKASTLYNLCGALPGLFNGYANPIAIAAIGWKYYIIWTCLDAFYVVVLYFLLRETKGKALEEIAEIFDGANVIAGTNAMKKYGMEGRYHEKETDVEEIEAA